MNSEVLGTLNSLSDARRVLDEVVIAGGYRPAEYNEFAPTYSRRFDGVIEELQIVKHGKRQWRVLKSTKPEGGRMK